MSEEIIKINNNREIKVTRHENGEVRYKTPYLNHERHGLEESWYKDGTKWCEKCG